MERYRDPKLSAKPTFKIMSFKDIENKFRTKYPIRDYIRNNSYFKKAQNYFNISGLQNMNKMKAYVNSPKYKQKFFDFKLKVTSYFNNINWMNWKSWKSRWQHWSWKRTFSWDNLKNSGIKIKNALPSRQSFTVGNLKYWLKKKTLKLIFYIMCFISFIYMIKYFFNHLKDRKLKKQLKQTHSLLTELKGQHEEIKKTNEELLKELQYYNKKI